MFVSVFPDGLWISSCAYWLPVNLEVSVQSFAHFRSGLSLVLSSGIFEHDLHTKPLKDKRFINVSFVFI